MADSFVPIATTSFAGESWGGAFDAVLSRTERGILRHKLTIKLRILLLQMNPYPPFALDADGRGFMTRPWSGGDWAKFVRGAQVQAQMWNNRFWLKPPPTVADYDHVHLDGTVTRPHIKCELEVDFNPPYPIAHKVIKVANLETRLISGTQDSSTFRSHSLLYDSLDNVPVMMPVPDQAGTVNNIPHFTIAHELGHALGLDHIGVLKKTALCQTAVGLNAAGFDTGDYKGGSNSLLCYGWRHPADVSQNIMGFGASFSTENAAPWVWSMIKMRGLRAEYWEVLTKEPNGDFFPPAKGASA